MITKVFLIVVFLGSDGKLDRRFIQQEDMETCQQVAEILPQAIPNVEGATCFWKLTFPKGR